MISVLIFGQTQTACTDTLKHSQPQILITLSTCLATSLRDKNFLGPRGPPHNDRITAMMIYKLLMNLFPVE